MIEHSKNCDVCGAFFDPTNNAQRHCPECAIKIKVVRARLYGRGIRIKGAALMKMIFDEIRSGIHDFDEIVRCKFCGGTNDVRQSGFCRTCLANGFDHVYEMTGKSNGWDRKRYQSSQIQDGWRGQKCAGGRAASISRLAGRSIHGR